MESLYLNRQYFKLIEEDTKERHMTNSDDEKLYEVIKVLQRYGS